MVALILALAVSALPPGAESVATWQPLIEQASARFHIPDDWIARVMRAESGGRTRLGGGPIRSSAGAIGLMQLMPGTWNDMRAVEGLGRDPDDPRDNILAGTAYLRLLYDRFGYPGLFAAYHAGPTRYADYLEGRAILPKTTQAYFVTMTRDARISQPAAIATPAPALFAIWHDGVVSPQADTSRPVEASIFVSAGALR